MTDTSPSSTGAAPTTAGRVPREPTRWTGVLAFGSAVLVLAGLFHLFAGVVSFFGDTYLQAPSGELVVSADYPLWGWVHLALGAAALTAGVGVMYGRAWARVLGVAACLVSAVVNLGFMAASPWSSTLIVAFDVLVIYALVVHGREAVRRG